MALPKAYAPQDGYMFQIFVKCPGERTLEHCDYATSRADMRMLKLEYQLAYGPGFSFRAILLPPKYWPKRVPQTA